MKMRVRYPEIDYLGEDWGAGVYRLPDGRQIDDESNALSLLYEPVEAENPAQLEFDYDSAGPA